MTGVELLEKLVPLIPPTYANLTRFHGVFAPTSRLRALTRGADVAVTVADDVSRAILRTTLVSAADGAFVCLYDGRFFAGTVDERVYFEQEHVAVSYAGDARGIVEDQTRRARIVRVCVPSLSMVADAVDGSSLFATVPRRIAQHAVAVRPHLRAVAVPFALEPAPLEMLWLHAVDADPAIRFLREVLTRTVAEPEAPTAPAPTTTTTDVTNVTDVGG